MSNLTPAQRLEQLKARHKTLTDRAMRVEVTIESSKAQLESLTKQAIEQFGTGDPEELRALYKKYNEENESKVSEFEMGLDIAAGSVADLEKATGAAQGQG